MQKDLILKEIDIVQAEIARYDSNGLAIKNWCIVVWSALSAFGLSESNPVVILIAIFITALFAMVEFSYRLAQANFILRAKEIEDILAADNLDTYKYSVSSTAYRKIASYTPKAWIGTALNKPQFYLFYLGLIVVGCCQLIFV